jgi:retron-type reverse transcriptase
VKACLEPELERHFHPDSYGYRPDKSALEALGVARQRCWRYDCQEENGLFSPLIENVARKD